MSAVPAAIRCLKCLILCFIISEFRIYNRSIRENTENTFFHHRGNREHRKYIFTTEDTEFTEGEDREIIAVSI